MPFLLLEPTKQSTQYVGPAKKKSIKQYHSVLEWVTQTQSIVVHTKYYSYHQLLFIYMQTFQLNFFCYRHITFDRWFITCFVGTL